jgi:hypothetical protein
MLIRPRTTAKVKPNYLINGQSLQPGTGITDSVVPVRFAFSPKGYLNLQAQGRMISKIKYKIYIQVYIYSVAEFAGDPALCLPHRLPPLRVVRNVQA